MTILQAGSPGRRFRGAGLRAALFLAPAALFLGVLVVYPLVATIVRSLYSDTGGHFVWFRNYVRLFQLDETRTALKNNLIWVIFAPLIVTAFGLVFAVLTERVRFSTAFKFVVFMPMAISFLASGVIFRLVYQQDPQLGLANAVVTSIHDTFVSSSRYPDAHPRETAGFTSAGGGFTAPGTTVPGGTALLPLVGIAPSALPSNAASAKVPAAVAGGVAGVVWIDFVPGGGGKPGAVDPNEKGLPGVKVQAVRDGKVVASATTADDGSFQLRDTGGPVSLTLPASNFAQPYRGVNWLGPGLVTPSIITAYVWMWSGFAMVLIAAGLAAIPRDALEAARVDGATEWQVFRRVTAPLLAPVLLVVIVTLVINVLKIFDLVFIISPGSSAAASNVLAVEMWRVSFGGQPLQGLGSAVAIVLFLLVVPAMLFNIRRFRRENT
jgi:alpha-glucoside transport system permease protein